LWYSDRLSDRQTGWHGDSLISTLVSHSLVEHCFQSGCVPQWLLCTSKLSAPTEADTPPSTSVSLSVSVSVSIDMHLSIYVVNYTIYLYVYWMWMLAFSVLWQKYTCLYLEPNNSIVLFCPCCWYCFKRMKVASGMRHVTWL